MRPAASIGEDERPLLHHTINRLVEQGIHRCIS
jgi:hypothetical protein